MTSGVFQLGETVIGSRQNIGFLPSVPDFSAPNIRFRVAQANFSRSIL
jgi:hypothetical protein